MGAGAPLRRLRAGDDADGRRRPAAQAAAVAAPARSAPELRPAPTGQALRPRPHSAEVTHLPSPNPFSPVGIAIRPFLLRAPARPCLGV